MGAILMALLTLVVWSIQQEHTSFLNVSDRLGRIEARFDERMKQLDRIADKIDKKE